MKKIFAGLSLNLITNEDNEKMATRKALNGALVINEESNTANFTESAPQKAHKRNTRVYNGNLLSLILKEDDGSYQVHTKTFNPLQVENFVKKISKEAKDLLQKAEGK